eukprot:9486718-Pyramimonas_sp.AAC.3
MTEGAREEQGRGAVAHEGATQVVHRLLAVSANNRERAVLVALVEVAARVLADGCGHRGPQ